MFKRYREILSIPGVNTFVWPGLLSRVSGAMTSISIVLMVQIQYDNYAMAGRVAAVGTIVWALQSVPTARLVDRYGQRKAMIPLTISSFIGMVILVTTGMTTGPEPLLWLGASMVSICGPIGSLTRARWSHVLKDKHDDVHSAFSLEGSLDETLFVVGPALSTILATTLYPAAGLLIGEPLKLIGLAILLSNTATEPPPQGTEHRDSLGFRIPRAVLAVTLITFCIGMVFGGVDISIVAFADESGSKAVSGVILGIFSLGSLAGGLYYGSRIWKFDLWQRLVTCAVLVAIGFALIFASPTLIVLAVIGFFAGMAVAPTMATSDMITQRVVKPNQITEGLAWIRIGIGGGVALGAWAAGYLVEHNNARWGFGFTAAAAATVMTAALLCIPWLKTAKTEKGSPADHTAAEGVLENRDRIEDISVMVDVPGTPILDAANTALELPMPVDSTLPDSSK